MSSLTRQLTPDEARRVRLHLALIPIYLWIVVSWAAFARDIGVGGHLDRSGHIKGHDFVHFYVLGEIARDHATAELYDFAAQSARTDRLVPEYPDRFLPVHTPQVAMFFAPLARLPYVPALTVWLILEAIVYAASCRWLWRSLPALRSYGWIVAIAALGFPPFYSLITSGQTSAFALAWFTIAFLALRADRPWLAGLALGALVYKPTLGLLVPLALLSRGQFRALAGAAVAAAVEFVAARAYFGTQAITGYVANFREVAAHPSFLNANADLMHSLRSFFFVLDRWPALALAGYLVSAAIVGGLAVWAWRADASLELRYAALLIATVLIDPHVYAYELVVLAAAFLLAASRMVERGRTPRGFWVLLYLSGVLPAFDGLTHLSGIRWSVVAMVGFFLLLVGEISNDSASKCAIGAAPADRT